MLGNTILFTNDIDTAASGSSVSAVVPDGANVVIDGQGHRLYRAANGGGLLRDNNTGAYDIELTIVNSHIAQ